MASVNANRSPIYILKADAIQPMAEAPCTSLSTCGARNKAITAEPKIIVVYQTMILRLGGAYFSHHKKYARGARNKQACTAI